MIAKRSWIDAVAGGGLGFLTGLVLGLSVHQVVGAFVAALAATLASFFGLSNKAGPTDFGHTVRVASFGVTCSCAVLLGIVIRTYELLAPSIADQVRTLTEAHYSPEEARTLIAFKTLGLVPKGATAVQPPGPAIGLFSGPDASCARLSGSRFDTVPARLGAMRNAGDAWSNLANALADLPSDRGGAAIEAAYKLVCG